ncbi:hypothetical protein CHU98_g7968 [Xylaria longipes]|nr:hypothetical protein CHU98_g7968 [Xylaria longipes]
MPCQTGSGTEQNPTIWAGATTFDSLPTEIRLMIWEEFVRIPRIIHIDTRNGTKAGRGFACYLESMDSGLGRRVKSEQVFTISIIKIRVRVTLAEAVYRGRDSDSNPP